MGKHFGELGFIRGIVYFKLSPHEQKPFAKAFTKGIPNFITRTKSNILYWLPPFLIGYFTYVAVEAAHHASKRKNPRDYANEVDPNPPCKKKVVKEIKPCPPTDGSCD